MLVYFLKNVVVSMKFKENLKTNIYWDKSDWGKMGKRFLKKCKNSGFWAKIGQKQHFVEKVICL